MMTIFLIFLVLWIAIGCFLLFFFAKARGDKNFQRTASHRVCSVGEQVKVSLQLTPPVVEQDVPPRDIILCFDESGSMGNGPGSPLEEAIRAGETFVKRCPPQIQVGIVRFDSRADIACQLGSNRHQVFRAIQSLGAGGTTAIHHALDKCNEALAKGREDVGKTVVLLSDGGSNKKQALAARKRLMDSYPGLQILCVGLKNPRYSGTWFHQETLEQIADRKDHCLILEDVNELERLYEFLALYITENMATAGIIIEEIAAPCPHELERTGNLFPVGIHEERDTTFVTWAAPIMGVKPEPITYTIVPTCPGWHKLVNDNGRAKWKLPDHSRTETLGPAGPRILALPSLLVWAWPILNPLLWLILGKRFCKEVRIDPPADIEAKPLPLTTLPEPLPPLDPVPYQAELKPALIIGLGEAGAWTLCHMKKLAYDRGIDPARLALLSVDIVHPVNQPPQQLANLCLQSDERVFVGNDLHPYLETLRGGETHVGRNWVPWREWLASPAPLSTQNQLNDRRKARLSLLLNPAATEKQLAETIERLQRLDPAKAGSVPILITGAAEDHAFSGLAAEIAHMCAVHDQSVTLVMSRTHLGPEKKPELAAFGRELDRMCPLGGEAILSDRQDPPVAARRLFNKVVVNGTTAANPQQAGIQAADILWPILAYPSFEEHLRPPTRDTEELTCWSIQSESYHLPMATLWRWVVAKTLSQSILTQWMGLEKQEDEWIVPSPTPEDVDAYAASFWRGEGIARPRPMTVTWANTILEKKNPSEGVLDAAEHFPSDDLYYKQVRFWQREQAAFYQYCEAWLHHLLNREQAAGHWGLTMAVASLRNLTYRFGQISARIDTIAGSDDFLALTKLVRSIYRELATTLNNMTEGISHWLGRFAGPLLAEGVSAPEDDVWIAKTLEQQRRFAYEGYASLPVAVQREADASFDTWWRDYGCKLNQQLHFDVIRDQSGKVDLQLRLGRKTLDSPAGFLDAIQDWLERYQSLILQWPLEKAFGEMTASSSAPQSFDSLTIGKHGPTLFPNVQNQLDNQDPHFAGLYQPREIPLKEAFRYSELPTHDLPFTWPEENQADRVAMRLTNQRKEDIQFTNPRLINLMRYPDRLQAFLADIAAGKLGEHQGQLTIERNGQLLPIGEPITNVSEQEAMSRFEAAARNVVIAQATLDGDPIPLSSTSTAQTNASQLEEQPILGHLRHSPKWREWQYVYSNRS